MNAETAASPPSPPTPLTVALVLPAEPPGTNNFHQVPIGSLYTAGRLRDRGMAVAFHDLRLNRPEGPEGAETYREIAAADLVVVFSADYDLAQCYPSLGPTVECVRLLRAAGARRIACAGSHATADPELTRRHTGCDTVVVGEFEFAVPDLAAELAARLAAREPAPERWPLTGSRLADEDELAALGPPAYDLAPMRRYFSEGFVDGQLDRVNSGLVLANRGCPFGCDFCYLFFGRRLRRRPVAATLAELRTLREEYGIRHFFFLDYTFTVDNEWAAALSDGILELGLDISWICQTRVDCLDDATLARMRRAGCAGIWLGVESPDIEQRRYLGKGRIGFEDIQRAVELIRSHDINVLAFVMVGLPNETEASLASLNSWLSESRVYYSLSTFQRRLGTPLAAERGIDVTPENGWGYLDHRTDHLGESELRRADLGAFFAFHDTSPTRVANVMRRRLAERAPS
ncbi:radical SAM protein [Streptomyces sp. 3MP-14]|uniref:Radical SAM protein n=1 Tax=Streptomyces mimosae TaxID=2586635 RepID=A0A5N5ZQN6_9ACTN|nr:MULTISPECIES: radical SAM protein [Streptomyces]KAB8158824.1 radical SAM protein [Streptomyces mimosae]KAB8172726.1 radical SAM protein [Streptomyces sp. 3MP-14]